MWSGGEETLYEPSWGSGQTNLYMCKNTGNCSLKQRPKIWRSGGGAWRSSRRKGKNVVIIISKKGAILLDTNRKAVRYEHIQDGNVKGETEDNFLFK